MNPNTDITIPTLRTFVGHDSFCINAERWSHSLSAAFIGNYQEHVIETKQVGIEFGSYCGF